MLHLFPCSRTYLGEDFPVLKDDLQQDFQLLFCLEHQCQILGAIRSTAEVLLTIPSWQRDIDAEWSVLHMLLDDQDVNGNFSKAYTTASNSFSVVVYLKKIGGLHTASTFVLNG
ncbi:hypothetical protein Tco_1237918 [Tanacetum coccineum]